jgi:hypothetical protein
LNFKQRQEQQRKEAAQDRYYEGIVEERRLNKCIFCGSSEEVELVAVDYPNNLKPVCIACREAAYDASMSKMKEEEEDGR